MFYIASKVVFFCIAPSHLCLIALGLGVLLLMRQAGSKTGRRLVVLSLVGFVAWPICAYYMFLFIPTS